MKLKIFNPDGVHAREIKGLKALKETLPDDWFGYASFEMIGHDGGEIDLVICANDRLIVTEIKDWNGAIIDNGNTWQTSGRMEKSPVIAVSEKAKKLKSKLKKFLAPKYESPWVDHCVLLTGKSRRSDLREESKEKTFELEFFKKIGNGDIFKKNFPNKAYLSVPMHQLKIELDKFFSADRVRPQSLSYSGYKAEDDPCYIHPKRIYSEFIASKTGARGFNALLRCWDFDKLGEIDPIYHNLENRKLLALREENAIGYLREVKPELSQRYVFLAPIGNEGRDSVTENFFELYDLPINLRRLKESLQRFGGGLKDDNRISLARLLLSHFSELHELQVTHRDIGEHCIWVSIPDKVSLSGFATSSFPEQKTVSQIRETIRAGAERIPEDVLEYQSTNYQKDVFLLGSVVHQILFGKRAESPDGFPAWTVPKDGKFERFWGWFERCLDIDPAKRFPDAIVAFEEFQRADQKQVRPSICEEDFAEFAKRFQPQPGDSDDVIRDDDHGLVFRQIAPDGGYRLIKVWANARYTPGSAAENFPLLEFFKRIQKLAIKNLPSQQKILDFGHTRYGSYVTLEWEDGCTLDQCNFEDYDDAGAVWLVTTLVQAVAEMHASGFYHGDLKPANILIVEKAEIQAAIRLIDSIDFAPLGTERRSSCYLPPEGEAASTPACDGYALWKIATDFLFTRMISVSESLKLRIGETLQSALNPDGGDPNLTGALREIESIVRIEAKTEDISTQEITIDVPGLKSDFLLTPTDDGLPVSVYPGRKNQNCFVVSITDRDHSLNIKFDASMRRAVDIWQRDSGLIELTRAMKRPAVLLRQPIRVQSRDTESLKPLVALLKEEGVLHKGLDLIRYLETSEVTADAISAADQDTDIESPIVEDVETISGIIEDGGINVPLEDIWRALIDAEESILPEVSVTGDPVMIESTGHVAIPVGDSSRPFEYQDGEPIQIKVADRDGKWRYYGNLDTRRTRPGLLVVASRSRNAFMPPLNSTLRIENKASIASYEKRLGAINRLLMRGSVCNDLIRYFACEEDLEGRAARFVTRSDELARYELNEEQTDALKTALLASPLSMIQGPPGTGKTSVISAAVHYIATHYRSARILVVSQSHEAIDHATEQIVKRFRKHGEEPSLVRVGRKTAVSDNLISFHSESLQGEYRERFRLSLRERVGPVGTRLGLHPDFVSALVLLRMRLAPIFRQLEAEKINGDINDHEDSVILRNLQRACLQLDPAFDFDIAELSTVYPLMEKRLAEQYGETDLAAIKSLREVIDLALEWIQMLEAPSTLERFYVSSRQIVTGTCVGVGRWDLGLEGESFDCVIIDEAARCGPGDLAVASQVAEQVILLGDHKQLPPFIDKDIISRVVEELGCSQAAAEQSDFQRLFRSEYAGKAGRTLKIQYRMQKSIGDMVSACFYPEIGGLEAGRSKIAEVYNRMPNGFRAQITWADTGNGEEESVGTSFVNVHEIDRIMELLEEISEDSQLLEDVITDANREMLPAAIGIIAAYKAQADAIEERIWTSSLPDRLRTTCKVGTVDSYQGKENPIVIFSAVRCNSYEGIGFTRSWERVNVSLSRARERLVIVGSYIFWLKIGNQAPLGKVAQYVDEKLNAEDRGFGILKCETEKL